MDMAARIVELEAKVAELEAELAIYTAVREYSDDNGEQTANIERVAEKIERFVLHFCRLRLRFKQAQFHVEALRDYVVRELNPEHETVAPASPDRILRLLRQQNKLDYIVLSRSESLYEVLWVRKDNA